MPLITACSITLNILVIGNLAAAMSIVISLLTRLEPQEIQALLQLYTAGTITQETLLMQLSEGEVLGDDFDVDKELRLRKMAA